MLQVKVKVENTDTDGDVHTILLDPMDFLRGFSVLKVTTAYSCTVIMSQLKINTRIHNAVVKLEDCVTLCGATWCPLDTSSQSNYLLTLQCCVLSHQSRQALYTLILKLYFEHCIQYTRCEYRAQH
jgi:hypothetical protein